jgi:hypothetical protein
MNRRDFCKTALNLGLYSVASSLLPWRAFADVSTQSSKPQFFILMRFEGGWDTSLASNPWIAAARPNEKDFFLEYRQDELLRFQNSFAGPALQPLQNYFDRMTLVNGIFMSANDGGHDSSALYASSGNGQGGLGILPLELEGRVFNSPFGTLADTPPYAGRQAKAVWDMKNAVSTGPLQGSDLLFDFDTQGTELSRARKAILSNVERIALFNKALSEDEKITSATVISAAFRAGLSSSVYLQSFEGQLDTHSNHRGSHLKTLSSHFTEVKNILDKLQRSPGVDQNGGVVESNTLLDQTTVMIVSEFTRTPALNTSQGKDHNPQANSTIVIGPGMKPGSFGDTTLVTDAQSVTGKGYLAGLPWDRNTQQVVQRRENSMIIRPENVVATVAKSMGADISAISKDLAAANILTSILK